MQRSNNVVHYVSRAGQAFKSGAGKVAAAGTGLLASASALAAATGPGDAIAGELSGGAAQLGIVFAAVAILLGLLILWAYMKRAR